MFTITYGGDAHTYSTLRDAIYRLRMLRYHGIDCSPIMDADGYIVSTETQISYLLGLSAMVDPREY
jgi:hypothetical protein